MLWQTQIRWRWYVETLVSTKYQGRLDMLDLDIDTILLGGIFVLSVCVLSFTHSIFNSLLKNNDKGDDIIDILRSIERNMERRHLETKYDKE